jgi:SAM-dependent methyltransferase
MIIENILGIPGDYQAKAIRSSNFFQRNWHKNKFSALAEYFKYFNTADSKTVLDIGTGSGNFEYIFHTVFKKIIGIDYNVNAITYINNDLKKRNIKNVKTLIVDITKDISYTIPNNLDVIIVIDVIEHIRIAQATKLLRQLYSKLNVDGKIIVITPNYTSFWYLIEQILDWFTLVPKLDGIQHLSRYTSKSLNKLFLSSGYSRIFTTSINTIGFLFPFDSLAKLINKLEFTSGFQYGNLIFSVFQKQLTQKQQITIWNKNYSEDQTNLYKNKTIQYLFNQGHYWIANQNTKNKNLLDFGCGIGHHLNFEKKNNPNVYYCVDKKIDMLNSITEKPFIKKILSDGKQIKIKTNSVDAVIASHIFEHITDLHIVLEELSRILKNDGTLLTALPCDPGLFWNMLSFFSPSRKRLQMIGLNYDVVMKHEHVHSIGYLQNILDKYYMKEKEWYLPFPFLPFKNFNLIYCAKYSLRLK